MVQTWEILIFYFYGPILFPFIGEVQEIMKKMMRKNHLTKL